VQTETDYTESSHILYWTDRAESVVLSVLLSGMILLSCLQIFLRTFLGGGLLWADPVLRLLVIWCGFLGGVAATGRGKHIAIDLISDKLPEPLRAWLELFVHLFCVLAAAGLSWAAWRFWAGEWEYGAAGPLLLPGWVWNIIYPLSFSLITGKYLLLLVLQAKALIPAAAGTGAKQR
jgi:TRAP-type C4-dicarboxylate transport system permease small subunit